MYLLHLHNNKLGFDYSYVKTRWSFLVTADSTVVTETLELLLSSWIDIDHCFVFKQNCLNWLLQSRCNFPPHGSMTQPDRCCNTGVIIHGCNCRDPEIVDA